MVMLRRSSGEATSAPKPMPVLADVPGFRQRGGIGNDERHVEQSRERLREERLARARRADQQDIGLRELDLVVLGPRFKALVVVVDGDRENLLRRLLADHILI